MANALNQTPVGVSARKYRVTRRGRRTVELKGRPFERSFSVGYGEYEFRWKAERVAKIVSETYPEDVVEVSPVMVPARRVRS